MFTADEIANLPTICGECHATVPTKDTKIVERPTPRKPGAKIFQGMTTIQEMRVCSSHDVVTNWPRS